MITSNKILYTFLAASLLLTSCRATEEIQEPVSSYIPTVDQIERPLPYPLDIPTAYLSAAERGTRTESGAPGERYWQNYSYYTLHADLDPSENRLKGTAQVTYDNNSPQELDIIVVELAQNLHKAGTPKSEITEITGGMDFSLISANNQELNEITMVQRWTQGMSGYIMNGTQLFIYPDTPISPGESMDFSFEWSFQIPQDGASGRMGSSRGNLYYLAYWYPKISVIDDVYGWFTDSFVGRAEFYHEFSDYDLTITAPEDWLVMGTGEFLNPEATLSEETYDRYMEAGQSDEPVVIVDFEEVEDATLDSEDDLLTWRFRAEKVRDVAFSATLESRWDGARTAVGDLDNDGETEYTRINAFYREQAPLWTEQAEYAMHAITFLSEYTDHPYPWPHMTSVEGAGIIGGGMEFPMMTIIGDYNNAGAVRLYGVTAHELAHMWFPMIVNSNERRYTWIDEGFTTFHTNMANIDYYGAGRFDQTDVYASYMQIAGTDFEGEIMRWSDYHYPGPAYGIASYQKPASVLLALKAMLGEEQFMEAHHELIRRWAYKSMYPWDIFRTFEDVTGRDLSWFWRSWYYETWVLDHGIESVENGEGEVIITVEDVGNVPMPTNLLIEFEDGSVATQSVDAEHWLNGFRTKEIRIQSLSDVTAVTVDPNYLFPDVDRSNNTWEAN